MSNDEVARSNVQYTHDKSANRLKCLFKLHNNPYKYNGRPELTCIAENVTDNSTRVRGINLSALNNPPFRFFRPLRGPFQTTTQSQNVKFARIPANAHFEPELSWANR